MNKQIKEELRGWTEKKLEEKYYVINHLQPMKAIEEYGYYLDPANTKFIDGVKHYSVIKPKGGFLAACGWATNYSKCPMQSNIKESYMQEAPITAHTDVTDEWKKAAGKLKSGVSWAISPERRLAKMKRNIELKGLKYQKGIEGGLAQSRVSGLQANKYALKQSMLPKVEAALPYDYQYDDSLSIPLIKHHIKKEKAIGKMKKLDIASQMNRIKRDYSQQYGLRTI